MANQQENSDLVIQLPWTVPQQENNQAVILQQPNGQKVYLDLNHSTDTTAIWSFVIAMIIAFILGISATIIAIWYGKKSFDLTKQSFDALVMQIESSERVTLMINERIFEQQKELQHNQREINDRDKWLFEVRNNLALYIRNYNLTKKDLISANSQLENFEGIKKITSEELQMLEKLQQRKEDLILNIAHFETFFNHTETHLTILGKGYDVVLCAAQIMNDFLILEKDIPFKDTLETLRNTHYDFVYDVKTLLSEKAA